MRAFILLIFVGMLAGCTLQRELAGGELKRVQVVRAGVADTADYGFRRLDLDASQVSAYAEIWGDSDAVDSVDIRIHNRRQGEIEIEPATARIALVMRGGERVIVPAPARIVEPDRVAWITTGGASVRPADVVGIILVCPAVELALVSDARLVARAREDFDRFRHRVRGWHDTGMIVK